MLRASDDIPQSNRATRRRRLAFGRGGMLETHLFPVGAALAGQRHGASVSAALNDLYAVAARPCFCCHRSTPVLTAGAILAAVNPRDPRATALSLICVDCWRDRTETEIEESAAAILRTAIPAGRFAPMPTDTS